MSTQAPEARPPVGEREPAAPDRRHPVLPPVAYPLVALIFGGILVFSFSRVLLAVSKNAAPAIGLLMALNVLVGAAMVAYGGRVRRRPVSFPLLVVGGAAVIAVGVVAMSLEGQPVEKAAEGERGGGGGPVVKVDLTAKDIAFDRQEISIPAGGKVSIVLDNQDAGIPHNVAIFAKDDPSDVVFEGDIFPGVATRTYPAFTAPAEPGTYAFRCDVHPTQMVGTVRVTAAGEAGGGGGGGAGGAPTVVAKDVAFDPTEVTVPGGGNVTIHFDNRDAGTPHNIQVFNGGDATAPSLFQGELITGPATTDYTFEAPPPGTYFFHCEVHPTQMTGTLTVT